MPKNQPEPVRDPASDHLLTPSNCAIALIDYQPEQFSTVGSTTRDEILLGVWGDDYYGGTRTVDVHVRRLRAKLGKDLENAIHTVRNVGYRFSPDTAGEDDDEESDPGSSAANSSDAGSPAAGSSDAAPTTGTPSRHPDSEEISA